MASAGKDVLTMAEELAAEGAPLRIMLTEEDFSQLCCGRTLKREGVEFALQDIGIHRITALTIRISDGRALPKCEDGCTLRAYHMGACLLR